MASQSSAQKKASKQATAAPGTLIESRANYDANPITLAMLTNLAGILANPGTMTPELVAQMKQSNAAESHAAAKGAQDEMLNRLGVTGNVRGGSAIRGTNDIAARLGEAIATGNRAIDIQAANQNRQDTVQGINAAMAWLSQKLGIDTSIANAQLGAASTLAGLAAQPTPLQAGLQGLGGLIGNVITAGGAAGGFGNLFGGGK